MRVSGTSVRETSTQTCEEEHAEGPDISGRPTILSLVNYFGCHVGWRSAENLDLLVIRHTGTEAKVDYLYVFVAVEKQILQLDIPMCDTSVVAVA